MLVVALPLFVKPFGGEGVLGIVFLTMWGQPKPFAAPGCRL
jgi:hypothetical protein